MLISYVFCKPNQQKKRIEAPNRQKENRRKELRLRRE
jgi:hypothetical protein